MGFKCGIVGLPNVGKSSLFNALTQSEVGAENYPFCTVEPNLGVVSVPDERLGKIANVDNAKQVIPSTLSVVDIAGLVSGASQGEGLGNQFLSQIRETDAILHVVRCFEDETIVHVSSDVSPRNDIEVVNTELVLKDLDTAMRAEDKSRQIARLGSKEARQLINALNRVIAHLDENKALRTLGLNENELTILSDYRFLTLKPTMYIANVLEDDLQGSDSAAEVEAVASEEDAEVVVLCADLEAQIAQLESPSEREDWIAETGLKESGLDRVIRSGYRLLNLQSFFTSSSKETRSWTIPIGFSAPQAAGKIHSDFERGFIRAEVVDFDSYTQYGGEAGARRAGALRSEGKEYKVCDGDVVRFLFNV